MPRAGFHNDNEYRAYPFVFNANVSAKFPNSAIVDCGFVMGIDSEFVAADHSIYLYSVTRTLTEFKFEFKTTAPGAENYPITFICPITAEEFSTIDENSAINLETTLRRRKF